MSLTILGAAYGLQNVTDQVQNITDVTGGTSVTVKASNDVFGDTWKGNTKSLVIVYQYSGEAGTRIAKEGEEITIHADQSMAQASQSQTSTVPTALNVLGAAYGADDVTEATKKLVVGTSLEITPDNDIFPETWKGVTKSFVGVFDIGVIIVKEGTYFSLAKKGEPQLK